MSEKNSEAYASVFDRFPLQAEYRESGWYINRLGVRQREFYDRALAVGAPCSPAIPPLNEEHREWVDILEAVTAARDRFVMVELGAGFGRWLVNAAGALRQLGDLPSLLVGVEAEPTHHAWMGQHFRDNGLDPAAHRLINAAVSDRPGAMWFTVGDAERWYGQGILRPGGRRERLRSAVGLAPRPGVQRVPVVTLADVVGGLERVDLVDMDIEGEESRVVPSSMDVLTERARRVHVGTHSPEAEAVIRSAFASHGWGCIHDTPIGGPFQNGVQTWVNPLGLDLANLQ